MCAAAHISTMSVYEWASGTITLPSSEVTRVRRALVHRVNETETRAFAIAEKVYRDASPADRKNLGRMSELVLARVEATRLDIGEQEAIVDRVTTLMYPSKRGAPVSRPLRKNMRLAKLSATQFDGDSCSITFNGNQARWQSDGNHSGDRAFSSGLFDTLVRELASVRWTAGSGGVIAGGNEYDRSERPLFGFGPTGALTAPQATRPFVRSNGVRVTQQDLNAAVAKNLRDEARFLRERANMLDPQGRDRIGRFDVKRQSSPEVTLSRSY